MIRSEQLASALQELLVELACSPKVAAATGRVGQPGEGVEDGYLVLPRQTGQPVVEVAISRNDGPSGGRRCPAGAQRGPGGGLGVVQPEEQGAGMGHGGDGGGIAGPESRDGRRQRLFQEGSAG